MKVPAYAKLNLSLEVLGHRADGYHEVRTVLQTIDLADRLDLQPGPGLRVECDDSTLEGDANLVWQAATALAQAAHVLPSVHIFVHKSIPVGMGLGGGSSDAASALIALNQFWSLGLSTGDLAQIAADLGSDVAFFLWGGTALASGRGEQIKTLTPLPSMPVILICPNDTIPNKTREMYSHLTPDNYSDGEATRLLEEILQAGHFVPDMLHNVFEEWAFQVFPGLNGIHQRVSGSVPNPFHLSGSGPALFCLPSTEDEYLRVSNALQPTEARVYLVGTVGPTKHQG